MKLQFTAVYEKVPEGYIAFVEELPGANTQAATLESEEALGGKSVIREPLRITAAPHPTV